MGLLGQGDDLATLLDQLYGQPLPVAYQQGSGHLSVIDSIEKLTVGDQAESAREFGRAAVDQQFGLGRARVDDPTQGDQALAGLSLEQGDGTATMLTWSAVTIAPGNQAKVDDVIVPGDDAILASMPQILQREYNLPFLEGRLFVDRLRETGGWGAVNGAWASPPESTEQILHPKAYPGDRPTTVDTGDLAGRLGGGWSEAWKQTMGELRIAVWLADGQPGTQEGPKAPIDLPKANAAAGWGGDRLVSLDGPDGTWAIVWQTTWDSPDDTAQFIEAASAAVADLPGAHAVTRRRHLDRHLESGRRASHQRPEHAGERPGRSRTGSLAGTRPPERRQGSSSRPGHAPGLVTSTRARRCPAGPGCCG